MRQPADRRIYPRFVLPSMYTDIAIRTLDEQTFDLEGHAYDLSIGGMRFELDRGLEPGQVVAARLSLPSSALRWTDRRPIYAMTRLVWVNQDDIEECGPVRMACVFNRFMQPGDEARLVEALKSGRYALAA